MLVNLESQSKPSAYLAAEQGHEEVVEQKALREPRVVKVEEQDGEGQGQVLLGWATEG